MSVTVGHSIHHNRGRPRIDRVFHVILTKTITIFAGRCIDQVNNYTCSCDLGFEGRNCDVDIDYCKSSLCVHGEVFRNLPSLTV